mmetsp:Transcript_44891/g.146075  ORF Transcript_44891/g.146075 Transcript_44891/m.146075 type:complete len:234 (+) Transcript_44891:1772-2473(+)
MRFGGTWLAIRSPGGTTRRPPREKGTSERVQPPMVARVGWVMSVALERGNATLNGSWLPRRTSLWSNRCNDNQASKRSRASNRCRAPPSTAKSPRCRSTSPSGRGRPTAATASALLAAPDEPPGGRAAAASRHAATLPPEASAAAASARLEAAVASVGIQGSSDASVVSAASKPCVSDTTTMRRGGGGGAAAGAAAEATADCALRAGTDRRGAPIPSAGAAAPAPPSEGALGA